MAMLDPRQGPALISCQGKVAFTSPKQAVKAAQRAARRKDFKGEGTLQPYRCRHCGAFHLGRRVR